MKNKNFNAKKRKYLLAFIFVMTLNITLGIFLLTTSFGQTLDKASEDKPPITAEVVTQKDSPLRLSIVNIDNASLSYQTVSFSIENISSQSVKGYVILGSSKNSGKTLTNFFPVKSFQAKSSIPDEIDLEDSNIQPSDTLSLSIDYVEFEDGSSWGQDVEGQSEQIAGSRAGVEAAIEQLKNLADKRETDTLNALLEKELTNINVPLPNSVQSEKWQKGFGKGYKGIVYFLKEQGEREPEKISGKLNEIKKNQADRRQKQ